MSTEEKFRAAVNVIRSLPKNGSYQPSYELQLRFYSYFKQATEGSCSESQPAFWEVVRRKKWEAWKKLGNMPKEHAMESYVEELKKIVETMSYNENVAEFLGSLGSFYEAVPQEDLQLAVGDIIERVSSRDTSPTHSTKSPSKYNLSQAPEPVDDDEDEYDDFKDSLVEVRQEDIEGVQHKSSAKKNGHAIKPAEDATELATRISTMNQKSLDQQVAEQLRETTRQLQRDLDRLNSRVRKLEDKNNQPKEEIAPRGFWPLNDVSPRTAMIIVLWPLVVHAAVAVWRSRQRR
ncbi:acyl-CoA-binding domain-containing protein 5 [Neocloeon triangulifer]|uniref:acyl-CoA-binding domain-containing protein 5 n=1 Tax=Neocloeon triangulifer TaxID=2078957 RepID=UPI00286F14F9|nr:acyl-CoA-binding domain-containing protein 5 [Neocloeon triangulifer]